MTRIANKTQVNHQKTRIPSAKTTFAARTLPSNKDSKTLLKSRFSRQASRDKVITYNNSNLLDDVGQSLNDAYNRKLI
jgi:hypothetical protein